MSFSLLLVVVAIVILIWVGLRFGSPRATPISPDDPLWLAAIQRARDTLAEMKAHHHEGRGVWVKFPLRTAAGTTEHVWGQVTRLDADTVRCTIETQPIAQGATEAKRETTVELAEIEDWQVELADGTIRGGFTTRAQAGIARSRGERVPRHIEEMLRRFRDQDWA